MLLILIYDALIFNSAIFLERPVCNEEASTSTNFVEQCTVQNQKVGITYGNPAVEVYLGVCVRCA